MVNRGISRIWKNRSFIQNLNFLHIKIQANPALRVSKTYKLRKTKNSSVYHPVNPAGFHRQFQSSFQAERDFMPNLTNPLTVKIFLGVAMTK
jgi:hypothetical protein